MNRAPYLKELINFMKNDYEIQSAKLNQNIMVYSQWNIEKLSRNFKAGIIIQPGPGSPVSSTDRMNGCKGNFDFDVTIQVQVKNARNTQASVQVDKSDAEWELLGSFPDAADLEDVVRGAMIRFNQTFDSESRDYSPFVLTDVPDPEYDNGFLVMKQVYKTRFVF